MKNGLWLVADNARYAKLRGIIECMKHTFFKQFEMATVTKRENRILHERVISEMRVGSRLCFKDLCPVRTSKEREINILENSGMVAEQDNRNICEYTILLICVSSDVTIALINNWICPMLQIFLFRNLYNILCNVCEGFIERNFLHG